MGQDYTHSVVDLDLQIRGGGGGRSARPWDKGGSGFKKNFPSLDPQLPFLRPIGARTLPFREAHAFMAYYVREYPGVSVGCQLWRFNFRAFDIWRLFKWNFSSKSLGKNLTAV